MNGKFEERLARLAFGDITPEEARKLEQEAQGNPDAARVLMEYRAMRDGLRGLGADVPADQLSKERLRDAILGQGLRPAAPEPARNGLSWLWMPTVACALAFGIFTVRNNMPASGGTQPMIVMDDAKTSPFNPNLIPPSTVADLTPAPVVEKVQEDKPTPVMTVASVAKAPEPRRKRRNRKSPIVIDAARYASNDLTTGMDRAIEAEKKELAAPSVKEEKAPEAVATLASAPIVLIDTGKNAETGASTATEGSANDVLVGG